MKKILLAAALLCTVPAFAKHSVVVADSSTQIVGGIGAWSDVAYAFAKGDSITINALAEKPLERMVVLLYPTEPIGKVRDTKKANYSFVMPQDGIIVIRFITDRESKSNVKYTISRIPANDEAQDYDTKVIWEKPTAERGLLIPKRAKS